MSYDVEIWSAKPIPLPEALPEVEKWKPQCGAWVYSSRDWQLVVNPPLSVLPEDVPEDAGKLVPGIGYKTDLSLEPTDAPDRAYRLLSRVSKRLGKTAHGVVIDPQTDTISSPTGVKRYRPQPREEKFSIVELSWWFTKSPLLTSAGLHEFIGLLERMLPEALPKRYGLYEPPQHLYAETGKQHFVDVLQEHDHVVWYPHRPVLYVSLSCSLPWVARQGFRAYYVKVYVEAQALAQPGWSTALDTFWRTASHLIQPFYGDVRTLHGFVRMGATYAGDSATQSHPVVGPWWKGIPRSLGHAAVLGEPYLAHWPRFVEAAQAEKGLAFLSTNDWTTPDEVSNRIGGIPDVVAAEPKDRTVRVSPFPKRQ